MILTLKASPKYLRSSVAYSSANSTSSLPRIDRDGGYRQAGLIRSVSVITKGEALGHDLWIDEVMLHQVADAINASRHGVKTRYTHPSLSGDGLGKHLGRTMDAEVIDDQVIADLHFVPSAHRSPDGDLAGYVLDLGSDDPTAIAQSVAFALQLDEMDEFTAEFSDELGDFKSPDPANHKNLIHARLAELHAADVVSEPAANPNGLFSREFGVAQEAEQLASYVLGLSDEEPELVHFDSLNADRIRAFIPRFLKAHKLKLSKESEQMASEFNVSVVTEDSAQTESTTSENVTTEPVATEPVATESEQSAEPVTAADPTDEEVLTELLSQPADRSEAARFKATFGPQGAVWFADGLSFDEARDKQISELQAKVESLTQQLSVRRAEGEQEPVSFSTTEQKQRKGFAANYRFAS